ncbi:MAG: PEP-utilizing enzyme [Candidatus Moranbacteria bacterium]|nr:PEP-utilizing enzyme [Candidatus Moranbacteria bacterium]
MKKKLYKILVKESNINFHNWYSTAEGFHHPVFKKFVGAVISNWLIKIEKDRGEWGIVEKEWENVGAIFAKRLAAGKIDIFDIEQKHYQIGEKIWRLTDFVYQNKLESVPLSRLLTTLRQMWKYYWYLNGIGYIAVISDLGHGYLMGQLSKILLQKKVSSNKIQAYQSLLSSPNKRTLFWQENLELLQLCDKHKLATKLSGSQDFDKHVEKWFWLNYGYQGPAWNGDDFLMRVKEIFRNKNIKKALAEHQKNFQTLVLKQRALSKKLKITRKENYYFETARLFTHLKGYRIEVRHRYSWALDQIFSELGRRLNLPLTFFRYATREEIISAATKKSFPSETVSKRKQKMLYVFKNLKGSFIKIDSVDKNFQSLLEDEKIEASEAISGQTAYSGRAIGKVKILEHEKDVAKIRKGDILVTFATTPDFLPAMIKASGFVTDQGGITSHAAITARELKKPCIIGTKIATKVLKDGDLVEVDADKGVVKIIKKRRK